MNHKSVFASVAVGWVLAACSGSEGAWEGDSAGAEPAAEVSAAEASGEASAAPAAAQRVAFTLRDAGRLAGKLDVPGRAAVEFDAVASQVDGGSLASVVRLGDESMEWSLTQSTGAFWFDGHGLTISAEHIAGAKALSAGLESKLAAELEAGKEPAAHERLLLAQSMWLADAQVGYTLGRHEDTVKGAGQELEDEIAYGYTNDFPRCIARGNRLAYIQRDSGARSTRTLPVGGTGKSPHHAGNWQCLGQCGEGCQSWWHNGHWLDCFEHDACTYTFPSKDCEYAFGWAADDFAASVHAVTGNACN